MGETLIDIRVWFAMLVIAFGFGRVDLTKTNTPVNEIVPDATITTCKSSDTALSEPFGQHLALDVKGIKADLLNSEDYLIKVITDAVDALDLHLMSCNCQKLSKTGISCLGVLDQAQISVQAWPKHGAIAVDLFTEGSKSLVPAANVLKGVLNAEGDNVTSFWSIDYRGEAVNDRHTDLYHFALNSMIAPVKKELLSMDINGQKLDIWEFVEIDDTVGHEDSIAYNLQPGDPRWTNNELARPEKECYLNGRFILSNDDESKQMLEAPVLTGMITQENPKQIAMVGGLADNVQVILKYKTESVTFFQPQELLINTVREYFPEIYNCSDLVGRSEDCFEDSTFTWVKEAGKSWFTDRYGETATIEPPENLFDVVYTRVTEPAEAADLSTYVGPLLNGVSPDGTLVITLGRSPTILHPRGDIGSYASNEKLFRALEDHAEVEFMMVFEDDFTLSDTSREMVPEAVLVVCKSSSCRQRFYAAPEEIDSQLAERVVGTHSNKPVLEYYDGTLQANFQVAPKAYETIYCRREPIPFECAYLTMDFSKLLFDFDEDPEKSSFEITETGVVATVDIPEGSFIMAKDLARSLLVSEATIQEIRDSGDQGKTEFLKFIDTFGHSSTSSGKDRRVLEVGASHLLRSVPSEEEANIGRWVPSRKRPKYSPVYDRHSGSFDVFMVATKDIPKGAELFKLATMWEG